MPNPNPTIHQDRMTPKNRYSISELCDFLKIDKKKIAKIVEKTLANMRVKANEMGLENAFIQDINGKTICQNETKRFAKYYNQYVNALISDNTINYFYQIPELEPIAHLLNVFIRKVPDGTYRAGFSILQSYFDKWRVTGKSHMPTQGKLTVVPDNGINKKVTTLEFDDKTKIKIFENQTLKKFRNGIEWANSVSEKKVSLVEMTLIAIDMYMQANESVFGQGLHVIDESKIKKRNFSKDKKECRPRIAVETYNQALEVVQRLNMGNNTHLSLSNFIEQATLEFISRLPVKYTDPEKYKEALLIERKKKIVDSKKSK